MRVGDDIAPIPYDEPGGPVRNGLTLPVRLSRWVNGAYTYYAKLYIVDYVGKSPPVDR